MHHIGSPEGRVPLAGLGSTQQNNTNKKETLIMQKAIESITLYYKSGSSDKVYQASIEPAGDGKCHVAFAYGDAARL